MKELSEAERGFLTNFCDMDLQGAEGALAVADGILRISQGDTAEGVFEATVGAIATGAILSSVDAIKGAKAIDGADDLIDLSAELSPEDAKKYLEFLENGSSAGLSPEELAGLEKLDELLALEKVEWKDVVRIRGAYQGGSVPKGTLIGKLDGLTPDERGMVEDLLSSGKNVEIIPRSDTGKTPDFFVDGVKTELKTLNGSSLNTPVTRIEDGFDQGAEVVIIDGRKTGLTLEQAEIVIVRALGKYDGKLPGIVEIWTKEGIVRR